LNEKAVGRERCISQKFVPTHRGTRKAGAIVEAAGNKWARNVGTEWIAYLSVCNMF